MSGIFGLNIKLIDIAYIVSSIFFIFGIKMLGKADTARRGNMVSSIGMLIAVVATLLYSGLDYTWIIAGIIIGAAIGVVAAKMVKMTSMPELVALFNGFGGLASLLVGWAEYERIKGFGWEGYLAHTQGEFYFSNIVIWLTLWIGGITFTGSILAYLKLSAKISGSAICFKGQKAFNALLALAMVAALVAMCMLPLETAYPVMIAVIALALLLGIFGVLPIGGGDMPVVISLLNSFSGLAAAAAGFTIANTVLIVSGCLVGASGFILTIIMCKAMNRTLANVLFSGFGATDEGSAKVEGEMKAASIEDAYYVLEAARSVVIIPGYGMAVAQAQHAVKELGTMLEANGAEVRYAIHPVAGRMPGHMNVLLAEADVPYEQLAEMDSVNPMMEMVDVALVIGANDVVNPAAVEDPGCPIYGMPIIEAYKARTVFALKRGKGAGFSGLVNKLYFLEKTRMLYGDAKATVSELAGMFKDK
ncbi:MAG: NAD(P)(+) transhydrogenase (Re/Si-specific) subunit beta [Opitutales bacterium]|nr:NAD(P)(+) transhydrogenase (Re/Si-specific) subunit beta [Opitutales bacterium]